MIRLLDTDAEHLFVPESEQNEDHPVTFYVTAMTHDQFVSISSSMRVLGSGGIILHYGKVLKENIKGIKNVQWEKDAELVDIDTAAQVRKFIDHCGTDGAAIALQEVFTFIRDMSITTDDEAGN